MKTTVKTSVNEYDITTGRGLLPKIRTLLPFVEGRKILIVTDENAGRFHLEKITAVFPEAERIVLSAGEKTKSIQNAERICNLLAEKGFGRKDFVFALGGGVIGDLAGFASSIYMRGIPYVQIPTTLLAGVDSSVGGKTAVNIAYGKNLVGRIYPPQAVVFDLDTLSTLPKEVWKDGMGEVLKYAILDEEIFRALEDGRVETDLETVVDLCIRYKKKVVERDENEKGERRLLNLGHTLGHAVERESDLSVTHGVAVACGLRLIVDACEKNGLIARAEGERILSLLDRYDAARTNFGIEKLLEHVVVDKKTEGNVVHLVTVHAIGDCRIEPVEIKRLPAFFSDRVKIHPGKLQGEIAAIPSKSFAHRILLCAALCGGRTEVVGLYPSEDILTTLHCIEKLGVRVDFDGERAVLSGPVSAKKGTFDCGESGSTLRFLLPVVAALGIEGTFVGRGRLPIRPIAGLLDGLVGRGITYDSDRLPLTIRGRLDADELEIDGSISSQFVTGLLLALSICEGRKKLIVTGKKVSEKYIDITLAVLKRFGVCWQVLPDGFVKEQGALRSPGRIEVEGDWSNAAFFLAAGALGLEVAVTNLRYPTEQGDAVILDLLEKFGATVEWKGDKATVRPGKLCGCAVDFEGCPDLAPILSAVAACAEGKTTFLNVDRLRMKESDRLESIRKMLKRADIATEMHDGVLSLVGGKPRYALYEGQNDHRMVMTEAILSLQTGGEINGISAVNKSYPDFFTDFCKLGGRYERI